MIKFLKLLHPYTIRREKINSIFVLKEVLRNKDFQGKWRSLQFSPFLLQIVLKLYRQNMNKSEKSKAEKMNQKVNCKIN